MLGKMLLQGLAAAAIIAGAAVAYSASADNIPQKAVPTPAPQVSSDTGYIQTHAPSYLDLTHRARHRYGKDERARAHYAWRENRNDAHTAEAHRKRRRKGRTVATLI